MALMLALSMVVGMTGAWFTDKTDGSAGTNIAMGTVKVTSVTAGATASLASVTTGATLANKMVDGDYVTVTLSMLNGSDVKVYAAVTALAVKVYNYSTGTKGDELPAYEGYFKYDGNALSTIVPDATATPLEVGQNLAARSYQLDFDSNGLANAWYNDAANAVTAIYVEITATVGAVQFAHVTDADAAYDILTA